MERQIAKTQAEGGLSDLEGAGKPLPERPTGQDAGEAAAMGMMAEAGVLPEEFDLKKQLLAARAQFNTLTDPAARKAQSAKIAELELRYNIAREARKRFFG
ncbi:DnaJ family domain-containing protein [uncultured Tateyamaria sp.]|uniref:DnaJ family domain-containing protein n=1 Tax=uncultured Tateyamaria sp. TaxID=455651 RepID=UPI00344C3327